MRTENNTVHSLGTLEITSGKILVSDPCYLDDSQHMFNFVEGCKKGTWEAEAEVSDEGEWGKRVATLSAHCEHELAYTAWDEVGVAGVDSGQMSIMDADRLTSWEGDEREHGWDPDKYAGSFGYQGACEITLRGMRGDILAGCMAVSSSGYGDGAYPVSVSRNRDGEIVAVKVDFIWDEDEDH